MRRKPLILICAALGCFALLSCLLVTQSHRRTAERELVHFWTRSTAWKATKAERQLDYDLTEKQNANRRLTEL